MDPNDEEIRTHTKKLTRSTMERQSEIEEHP
jgi:hypothetical protein